MENPQKELTGCVFFLLKKKKHFYELIKDQVIITIAPFILNAEHTI